MDTTTINTTAITTAITTADSERRRSRRTIRVLAAIIGTAILVTMLGACESDKTELDAVRNAVNHSRAQARLPALKENFVLDVKADAWAQTMRNRCAVSHSSLAVGVPPGWTRLGENVGLGASVKEIHTAYMNSPRHRPNILDPGYNQIGTAAVWGNCKGHRTLFTVHVFMTA